MKKYHTELREGGVKEEVNVIMKVCFLVQSKLLME